MKDASSWERLAQTQPYWAVLSHDEYRGDALDGTSADAFWSSGEVHVAHVLKTLRGCFHDEVRPASVLDFGCGVGRLLRPFAREATDVVGVDVSPTMIALARGNLDAAGLDAVRLAGSLESLSRPVDLVHSVLVFQHIPPRDGYRHLTRLVDLVAPGGYGYLQFRIRAAAGPLRRTGRRALASSHSLRVVANTVRSRGPEESLVAMFEYDAGTVLGRLRESGVDRCHVSTRTGDGGSLDAVFCFRRDPVATPS